jgi:hypothetical protein
VNPKLTRHAKVSSQPTLVDQAVNATGDPAAGLQALQGKANGASEYVLHCIPCHGYFTSSCATANASAFEY